MNQYKTNNFNIRCKWMINKCSFILHHGNVVLVLVLWVWNMLVRNIVYSFTQSFTESFPVLFWSCQMDNFHVVSAYFLFRASYSIDQLLRNVKHRFSSSFCFLIASLFCVMITYFISSLNHFTTFELSTLKYQWLDIFILMAHIWGRKYDQFQMFKILVRF